VTLCAFIPVETLQNVSATNTSVINNMDDSHFMKGPISSIQLRNDCSLTGSSQDTGF
jgi:hypothetical protein